MKKYIAFITFIICFLLIPFAPVSQTMFAHAKSSEGLVSSKAALLIDKNSGTVIFEENADKKLPVASMTKIVSLAIVFDYIENQKLSLDEKVVVSEKAAKTGGSQAFLDEGSMYCVGDLIETVIVASANDSMVALAEKIMGSEDGFVEEMNKYAKSVGMDNSHFVNSTGLPADNHYSTARDMVKAYLKVGFRDLYKKYASTWMYDFIHPSGRKTEMVNTNKLIKNYKGCDGGKTGFTNQSGFCLTAAATRGNMTLVGSVLGDLSSRDRFKSMSNMFDYGFNNFENKKVVSSLEPVGEVLVRGAAKEKIKVFPEKDCVRFLKKGETEELNIVTKIDDYVKAPVDYNCVVGSIYIYDKDNNVVDKINVISGEEVPQIKLCEIFDNIYKNW